jgi:glycogen debranching enzyme
MIVWSYRNPENAIAELRSLLKFQQPNGFIPQIIFWHSSKCSQIMRKIFLGYSSREYTPLTQIPMLAYSLRALWNASQDKELLREFVPEIVRYLAWWESRDHDNDGLISIIYPWESGMDASPTYDLALGVYKPNLYQLYSRYFKLYRTYRKLNWNEQAILHREWFNVEDVGVCSVYANGWGVLGSLAEEFDPILATRCYTNNKKYQNAIINKCWDYNRRQFVSLFHQNNEEKVLFSQTVQTLLPILLDDLPKDIQLELVSKIKNPEIFGLPYPIPSVAKSEVTFNPQQSRLLWRGPTWPSTNWLIMEGLLKHGFKKEAGDILDKWVNMYLKHGIYEYYNPLNGQGLGQNCLGMSTIIVDMLHRLKFD